MRKLRPQALTEANIKEVAYDYVDERTKTAEGYGHTLSVDEQDALHDGFMAGAKYVLERVINEPPKDAVWKSRLRDFIANQRSRFQSYFSAKRKRDRLAAGTTDAKDQH